MKISSFLPLAFLLLHGQAAISQMHRCGWDMANAHRVPAERARMDRHLRDISLSPDKNADDDIVFTLPVVFHIIHNNGPENLSDQQVQRALGQLNGIFSNSGNFHEASGQDIKVNFCLAIQDENAAPSTGIERFQDPAYVDITRVELAVEMMMKYGWPTDRYVNIYIVRDIRDASAFATYPSEQEDDPLNGIVIISDLVGGLDTEAGVLAHEMGHYLGLYHTFEGGCPNHDCLLSGDMVCDTPPDNDSIMFEGCTSPNNNCHTDSLAPNPENPFETDVPDLHENLLDYNQSACLRTFTAGQRARMRNVLTAFRPRLTRSAICSPPSLDDVELVEFFPDKPLHCDTAFAPKVLFTNRGLAFLQDMEVHFSYDGQPEQMVTWQGLESQGGYGWAYLPWLHDPAPGLHTLHVRTAMPNGRPDPFPANDTMSTRFWVPFERPLPLLVDFENGMPPEWYTRNWQTSYWEAGGAGICDDDGVNSALSLEPGINGNFQGTLLSPWIDLAGHSNPKLLFDHAYKRSGGFSLLQVLQISVFKDCNLLDTSLIFFKSQNQLTGAFNHDKSITWRPTFCEDWRHVEIDLSQFSGQRIMLAFESNIGRENYERLHIDNIQVTSDEVMAWEMSGIPDSSLQVYPVPNDGRFQIEFPSVNPQTVQVRLYNSLGQMVKAEKINVAWGQQVLRIDYQGLATGVYSLQFQAAGQNPFFRKLIVEYR